MGQNTITVTDSTWDELVTKSEKPILVDFWASWCAPCLTIGPTLEELAGENADRMTVGKLNVDENQTAAQRYGVMSIPSLLLFIDGTEKVRIVGAKSKAAMIAEIDSYLTATNAG